MSPDSRFQTCPPLPTEEAHSDDSSSDQLDQDDQPGPSGTSGQSVPLTQSQATTEPPPQETPAQHPPSWPIPLSPGHVKQQCVHHYREPGQTHKPKSSRDLGAVAVGTRFRGQRPRKTGELGGLLSDRGVDSPREPTLHEALSYIMGAYHHSQETMATVLAKFQETQQLQEEQYLGFREELKSINTNLGTIVGVLKDLVNTRRDTVAQQGAPDTSLDDELPTTSAIASGQEGPPQDHDTSTPPPANGEPPRKRSLIIQDKDREQCQDPHQEIRPP
ncbi:hypothetical protein NDU88_002447 [Pleurodeles waltl]|uniref:Uncharacterized protein n=1 Tax=Pleurodeles waltl TaxID=8319 RepID=A0AAV7VEG6_PLEWA|nr:hypothetical protein NDU88_002447 [Pleurodeles waltl]